MNKHFSFVNGSKIANLRFLHMYWTLRADTKFSNDFDTTMTFETENSFSCKLISTVYSVVLYFQTSIDTQQLAIAFEFRTFCDFAAFLIFVSEFRNCRSAQWANHSTITQVVQQMFEWCEASVVTQLWRFRLSSWNSDLTNHAKNAFLWLRLHFVRRFERERITIPEQQTREHTYNVIHYCFQA